MFFGQRAGLSSSSFCLVDSDWSLLFYSGLIWLSLTEQRALLLLIRAQVNCCYTETGPCSDVASQCHSSHLQFQLLRNLSQKPCMRSALLAPLSGCSPSYQRTEKEACMKRRSMEEREAALSGKRLPLTCVCDRRIGE